MRVTRVGFVGGMPRQLLANIGSNPGFFELGNEEVPQAVDAILAEWTSGRDYATRIENISGTGVGPRDNGDYFLQVDQTVEGNSLVDDLTGGSNLDWFLYTLAEDILNDPEGGETELNLPSP